MTEGWYWKRGPGEWGESPLLLRPLTTTANSFERSTLPCLCGLEFPILTPGFGRMGLSVGSPAALESPFPLTQPPPAGLDSLLPVCGEVDPFKPLPSFVQVRTPSWLFAQPVDYDWKPDPCLDCRSIHHNRSNCPMRAAPASVTNGGSDILQNKVPNLAPRAPAQNAKEKLVWKVVHRNSRPLVPAPAAPQASSKEGANKFSLRADMKINTKESMLVCNRDGSSDDASRDRGMFQEVCATAAPSPSVAAILTPLATSSASGQATVRVSGDAVCRINGRSSALKLVNRPQHNPENEAGFGVSRINGNNLTQIGNGTLSNLIIDPMQDGCPLVLAIHAHQADGLGDSGSDRRCLAGDGYSMGLRRGFLDSATPSCKSAS